MQQRNLGGRPRKLDVKLNPESLESMIKNVWAEVEETKLKAVQQYNKQIRMTNDSTDIQMIGKINVDYLKTINETSEKKISLARLVKDYLQKDGKVEDNSNNPSVVSEAEKQMITDILKAQGDLHQPEVNEDDVTYDNFIPPTLEEIEENEKEEIDKILNGEDEDITDVGF